MIKTKYDFKEVERNRYQIWKNKGYFKTRPKLEKPFTIVIPPPNVTGKLHLGHAWDNTLQDIITRRKRMQGYDALFLPGMDHAGIATQAKVDQKLKEMGLSRFDIGREKFLEHAWDWKEEYANHIRAQWEALGISVDYDKERFTLDEGLNKAVNHVFIKLYEKDLIYRGNRIINWDVQAKTALSNIEVEHETVMAKLYYFKYPLQGLDEFLTIATTRPETMFADQALMVHPQDNRYQKYIGKKVAIPGTNVFIPVIADDYVDQDFGTGVVKVTPAHDPNDFQVGLRHNLDMPLCMDESGHMNDMAFEYKGLERFEARKRLVENLTKMGYVAKIDDYETSIGYSERTGVVVEPRLSLQWFVKMDQISQNALLKSTVKWVPKRFEKLFVNWMKDSQDWCISRQLWWGHRIPAWYKGDQVVISESCPGEGFKQDEDVLDTWFSSALWPFSTLGWPEETDDFKRYFPTNVLVSGYDIIGFWMSRMIFMSLEFTQKSPFEHILIHGLIRASDGRKMSKSYNNGIDPIDVINTYGVDALRYFLSTNSAPGLDLRYEVEKMESSWNFINKLWNIARYVFMNLEDYEHDDYLVPQTLADHYILESLNQVIQIADQYYENFEFAEAAKVLYNFIWDEFASWYVEFSKISIKDSRYKKSTQSVLYKVLSDVLKLMHPFMPFVTETLYQSLTGDETIMLAKWPEAFESDQRHVASFDVIKDMITSIRNLRNQYDVAPSKKLDIVLVDQSGNLSTLIHDNDAYLTHFLNTKSLTYMQEDIISDTYIKIILKDIIILVDKKDMVDVQKEIENLTKQKEKLASEISRCESLLNNEAFVSKAPKSKIDAEKEKYQSYLNQYESVSKTLSEKVSKST